MNSLDDLRSTLDARATEVADAAAAVAPVRVAAVRHRVQVVRRRRRGVAGAVAVLAVLTGVAVLPDRAPPAPEPAVTVVGLRPPAELTSLGFTYAFDRGVDGDDGRAVLELAAADEPRLVTWATSGEEDTVRIRTSDEDGPITYTDADFTGWTLIHEGSAITVRATTADPTAGDPGLAVYTLTGDRPPGVSKDGVTFRQTTADGTLIAATIGDTGQNSVTAAGVNPGEGLGSSYYCSGAPRGAYLHLVDEEGEEQSFGPGCDDTVLVDPASAGGSTSPSQPGVDVERTLYVTDGRFGPPLESDDLRLGIGLYALDTYGSVNDFTSPTFEHDGHTWTRVAIETARAADGPLVAVAPTDGSAVLALAEGSTKGGTVQVDFADGSGGFSMSPGGGTWQLVSPGGVVTVTSRGARSPDAALRVAFYLRAD